MREGVAPVNQICMAVFLAANDNDVYNRKSLMLQKVLFCPVLTWCAQTWVGCGVRRFFICCDSEMKQEALACFPADVEILWSDSDAPLAEFAAGYQVQEIRQAVFPQGEEMTALTSAADLVAVEERCRQEQVARLRAAGVRIMDGASTYIDPRVTVAPGTEILPGTILRGCTEIGPNCEIGPNALVENSRLGEGVKVNASQVYDSVLERGVDVGPYAHIRPKCHVGEKCHVGAFVQLKNCNLGPETKMSHLTYVGDSDVGARVNFGCGTVTSNYDGFKKHRTVIGDDVFVGCNTNLVPPVRVENGAYIAAGTTVTRDVPADSMVIGRVRQEIKEGWAARWRKLHGK